jgi:hypothetical protein
VWRVACGVWRVACGVWRVAGGVWRVACGVWRVACGVWRVACGVWRLACGGQDLTAADIIPTIVHPCKLVYMLSAEELEIQARASALFAACPSGIMLPGSAELVKLAQEVCPVVPRCRVPGARGIEACSVFALHLPARSSRVTLCVPPRLPGVRLPSVLRRASLRPGCKHGEGLGSATSGFVGRRMA